LVSFFIWNASLAWLEEKDNLLTLTKKIVLSLQEISQKINSLCLLSSFAFLQFVFPLHFHHLHLHLHPHLRRHLHLHHHRPHLPLLPLSQF